MAVEKYQLQRLLEMRERTRDDAARYLEECQRQLDAANEELRRREQAVSDCLQRQNETHQTIMEKSRDGIKTSEIARFRQYLIELRETEIQLRAAVVEQQNAVARAQQTADKALAALAEAAKEVKVIEKHRENWRESTKLAATRREQKTSDELATILHGRGDSE